MTRARRNSPAPEALSAYMQRVERTRVPRGTSPQSEFGGLCTSPLASLLVAEQRQKEAKKSRNRKAEDDLDFAFRSYGLPAYVRQFKLLKTVQTPRADGKQIPNVWRFDFCFEAYKLIVEVDGGIWMPGGGAHSHPLDIERNIDKRNDAVDADFGVLAFTPKQVKSGHAVAFVQGALYKRGWRR